MTNYTTDFSLSRAKINNNAPIRVQFWWNSRQALGQLSDPQCRERRTESQVQCFLFHGIKNQKEKRQKSEPGSERKRRKDCKMLCWQRRETHREIPTRTL